MPDYALGIDVGYSANRPTTGLCLITLDGGLLNWKCLNVHTDCVSRRQGLGWLIPQGVTLMGVGIDGPLAPSLRKADGYRSAEALLSRGVFQRRGKPGQTSSPLGQKLHVHATNLAKLVLDMVNRGVLGIAPATHADRIHDARIVESFPTAFLSVLLADDEARNRQGRKKSDAFWDMAVQQGYLSCLLNRFPGQVRASRPLDDLRNHDHRAAFVCALTALCVAYNQYVAVGDAGDGDIMLPKRALWGLGPSGQSWAEAALRANLPNVRGQWPGARVLRNGGSWI